MIDINGLKAGRVEKLLKHLHIARRQLRRVERTGHSVLIKVYQDKVNHWERKLGIHKG